MVIKGRKILVTGGAGFIGSHLVDALVKEGAHVLVLDDLSSGQKENLNSKAVFYKMDMGDPEVVKIFQREKPEIVYHLAFNTNMHKSVEDPLFDARGIAGSLNIFNSAHLSGVQKVIMASSAMVYGNYPPEKLPVTEDYPSQSATPYAISKMATENYLQYFYQTFKLPIVILRYPTVFGPRQTGGALADYIRKIRSGQSAAIFGDGMLTRDYVYIEDITKANLLTLDFNSNEFNPVFNLGSAQETTLNDLHKKIAILLDKSDAKPAYESGRIGEIFRFCVSNEKARRLLNWSPEISLDEGLKLTIESSC